MSRPDYIPADYKRITVVKSLSGLFRASFNAEKNCFLYPRRLKGDFNALAAALAGTVQEKCSRGRETFFAYELEDIAANLDNPGAVSAIETVLEDLKAIDSAFPRMLNSTLRLVWEKGYDSKSTIDQFHADGTYYPMGRICCSYTDPVTEFIRNEDAVPVRPRYYEARDGARIYSFQPGDIWRMTGMDNSKRHKDEGLSYFIHRAPPVKPGDSLRLLLVAG